MNIHNGIANIEHFGSIGINLSAHSAQYREPNGTIINIPLSVALRISAVAQTEAERQGLDWELVQRQIIEVE